jgi:two-component system KDP operon response regulator KdpE
VIVAALDAAGLNALEASTSNQAVLVASIAAPGVPLVYLVDDAGTTTGMVEATCRAIRARSSAPIIAIVGQQKDGHGSVLAEAVDDWLKRPRRPREIVARVLPYIRYKTRPRRRRRSAGATRYDQSNQAPRVRGVFVADGLLIDFDRRSIRRDGRPLHISNTEWRILGSLARPAGEVVPRQTLLNEVWNGSSIENAARRLRVHLTYLRRKLERVPGVPRLILTELGFGYRLVAERMPGPHQELSGGNPNETTVPSAATVL